MQVKIDYDNDDGHDSDFEVSEEEVDDEVSGRDERGGDSYYYINSEGKKHDFHVNLMFITQLKFWQ